MKNQGKNGARRGIAASLHVKKHTKGTSNELSLSILDDRRSQVDEGASPAHVAANTANASHTFAFRRPRSNKSDDSAKRQRPAISGADVAGIALSISDRQNASSQARDRALANPEAEIKRRKHARRARRVVGLAAALAACAAVVAFAAYSFSGAYENIQQHKALLSQGFDELVSADDVVLPADSLVVASFDELDESQIDGVTAQFDDARVKLSAAESYAKSAKEGVGDTDAKAADQLSQSADARKQMLQLADEILAEEQSAKQACALMANCWEAVISADNLVRDAAELVTETTEENTRASQAKSEQALASLEEAESLMEKAQAVYPADYSTLSSYIAKRKEAIGFAIASDQAIYVQGKATAEANNASYNEADEAAAKLAAKLPKDAGDPIAQALQGALEGKRQEYMACRTQAASCDAFIRDYLGIRD